MSQNSKAQLPKKSINLSAWYNRVVLQAELADYGPAKGTMIFRPYGYRIWELIQAFMDPLIKDHGVENAYFPLLIPESLLKKEKQHVAGFAPEVAVVTYAGGEELKEKLVVRPTSETVMYEAFARWIHSWRDLPVLINQWNNVVRWEKRTYLFLRTSEFLWQEGHTAHMTHEDALATVDWALNLYSKTYQQQLAIPGYMGRKSDSERFAGAVTTKTYEVLMPEGKALQGATSHDLGQNFSKVLGIEFQTKDKSVDFAWQTSWGLSTRSIGALLMVHGDDLGLRLPPKVAPVQVVILPIRIEDKILKFSRQIADQLRSSGVRIKIDDREEERVGFKHYDWEMRGVPLRIEIGANEITAGELTVLRRDTAEKLSIKTSELAEKIPQLLDHIQTNLYREALEYLKESTRDADSFDQFKAIMIKDKGFIRAFWCEDPICEAEIKAATKATVRCLPEGSKKELGQCVHCGKKANFRWLFAQSY